MLVEQIAAEAEAEVWASPLQVLNRGFLRDLVPMHPYHQKLDSSFTAKKSLPGFSYFAADFGCIEHCSLLDAPTSTNYFCLESSDGSVREIQVHGAIHAA